ncbi:TPA: hypothetical protein SMF39_001128 [Serratia marcescens]|uniref:hypothetical protein n=1 Tax=Serratia TaxID=613 RepID=UPI0018D83C7F|nr:hypothetical protein [Serratia marcescens]MBH2628884.1 hypothetical protein [Serratia marcescens]MBH2642748.1 hypothetical protein [Serratia marcescens]MBN5448145.1 hypothetical protein [Serratia marcescens]HEJ6956265.1 hypothetical protein [Serratia marcescens]
MTLGNEDVLASLAALLELLTHCDEDTKIETVQATALLGWRLLKKVNRGSISMS